MASPEHRAAILAKLDEIEAEMKSIDFWIDNPPSEGNFMEVGLAPWLQGVFLPHAREATKNDTLPDRSDVGVMALREYDYMGTVEKALPLVRMLNEFDKMILDAAPTSRSRRKSAKKKSGSKKT